MLLETEFFYLNKLMIILFISKLIENLKKHMHAIYEKVKDHSFMPI